MSLSTDGLGERKLGTYLKHPVLGSCTNNDFAVRIIQLGILTIEYQPHIRNIFLQQILGVS
jgi:hypothetical protein